MRYLLSLFFLLTFNLCNADSTYVKKYCLAYNYFKNNQRTDNNLYAYTNIYNNKHDYWIYVNYFDRVQKTSENIKSFSSGFFYDYTLSKKLFIWSYYQGEHYIDGSYTANQLSAGLGFYLLNNPHIFVTMNNGLIWKTDGLRYNFRIKSRLTLKNCYFETFNYIQPELGNFEDFDFITFNTFTRTIYKQLNFKTYQWMNFNSTKQGFFQYVIFGLSFENWKTKK